MLEFEHKSAEIPVPLLDLEADYDQHKGVYGVLLRVKSPGWEELFKKISGGKTSFVKKGGIESDLYDFPLQVEDREFYDLIPSGKQLLKVEPGWTGVSLFYLRTPGIGSGIEVFYPGLFENSTIHRYAVKAGERSLELYKKLSPGGMRMKVWIGEWGSK